MNKYPHLFSPIRLRNQLFRNRLFASPTGMPMISPPVYLNDQCVAFYEERAKGGAAAVSLGDGIVHTPSGLAHPHKLRLDDPAAIPSLSEAARAIRQHGAVPVLELSHAGKYANVANFVSKDTRTGLPPYGPDHEMTANGEEILEMPEDLILQIVDAYGRAAKIGKMCGFGMILLHAGHGWLLNQFLSPATNHRKDKFGGSLENRARFALMALDAIRASIGNSMPIEFRMSGAEFTKDGYDIDEGIEIAKLVSPKVDLIHVSAGVHDDPDTTVITHPDMFHERGCNVWLAERIKKAVGDTPVATIGALQAPEMMEEIIASGKADVVEMSRSLIADPKLPLKAMEGRENDIRHCVRCFLCLHQTGSSRNIRCTVNPEIGREREFKYQLPATEPKKVLVVGGGPGGMEAACACAKKGHDVTLCEMSGELGGQLLFEEHIPFKQDFSRWRLQKEREIRKLGVHVKLNTEVNRDYAVELCADVIICASGAEALIPAIPGINLPIVKGLSALREGPDAFGRNVVIIGGGLVGCESAVFLSMDGRHKVTVVEMLDSVCSDATAWHKEALRLQMKDKVNIYTLTKAVEVTTKGLQVEKNGTHNFIPADTIFCAAGMRSRFQIVEDLAGAADRVIPIGDCASVGQAFQAISQGCFVARDI